MLENLSIIEKAQQDLVKAKHRYDAVAATLKDLLDKRDALRQKKTAGSYRTKRTEL